MQGLAAYVSRPLQVRVELYDESGRLLQSKPRRFMVY
jgi:hypothetical protein